MAKLAEEPYPGFDVDWSDTSTSFQDKLNQEEEKLDELMKKQPKHDAKDLKGAILRFPVADGYAIYIVTQHKPLTVQHVPAGDAWAVDNATVRGLNISDVRRQLEHAENIAELFGGVQ